jgi:pSer/pThr/pTyr-binding forkhead associated (FHA) protein
MFRLTLNFGGQSVRKFNFDQGTVCIGRDPDCEVPIDNIGVSRRHATIERAGAQYVLTDLKSHNGTFVRGQRVYHHELNDGDEFFIGKYSIGFENLEMATAAPEPAEPKLDLAGMQDMTFRLEKNEIEKILGASSTNSIPKLALFSPAKEQATYLLDQAYHFIGRNPRCTVKTTGFRMADFVALVVRNEKWFHIVALSPRHPVKVNGQRVTDHQLGDGDMIAIGRRKLRFNLG